MTAIPFHKPWLSGQENRYLSEALQQSSLAAGGTFTQRCEQWLQTHTQTTRALLTASCTNALELAAVLIDIKPGDEVILPSFTFTSTATAFVLRGATPVFVDIRPDTLNLDESLLEAAITEKTRAIVPVHYAGISCDMDAILAIAQEHRLWVIEDAAQGVGAFWRGKPLGTLGHLGCYSFHSTKNLGCGEGGALLINDTSLQERAEILHDKGTTRAQWHAGRVRQYEWVDLGLSAPPSELQAAFLLAQLEQSETLTQARKQLWDQYHKSLSSLPIGVPQPATAAQHNAHIFWITLGSSAQREEAQHRLANRQIQAALHYQPLHLSPAGQRYGRPSGPLPVSSTLPYQLLRLPLWPELPEDTIFIIKEALESLL